MNHQLSLYSSTVCDIGTVRSNNQDSSFAGKHLLAVCDGMGGHAGGDTASLIAVRELCHLEQASSRIDVGTASTMMSDAVIHAHDAIVHKAHHDRNLASMGTTVTAVALVNNYWVLSHIGDSRAYLLRDGTLRQVTSDHSYVQYLIDSGHITQQEARNHPQRNIVIRVLGDFDIDPHPDIAIIQARDGDRWLLCSDGLSGVLEDDTMKTMLLAVSDRQECASQLVSLALKAGSTDNVTVVVADSVRADHDDVDKTGELQQIRTRADSEAPTHSFQASQSCTSLSPAKGVAVVGGAACANLEVIADSIHAPVSTAPAFFNAHQTPNERASCLIHDKLSFDPTLAPHLTYPQRMRDHTGRSHDHTSRKVNTRAQAIGAAGEQEQQEAQASQTQQLDATIPTRSKRTKQARAIHLRARRCWITIIASLTMTIIGLGCVWYWSQNQYYLGERGGDVAIFQGVPADIFGLPLSREITHSKIKVAVLPRVWRERLAQGITFDSLDEAKKHVHIIELEEQRAHERLAQQSVDEKRSDTTGETQNDQSNNNQDNTNQQSNDQDGTEQAS